MSWEFFDVKLVVARKVHRCDQCGTSILVGEQYHYGAGKFEGDFMQSREHKECREAWLELNRSIRLIPSEEAAPFLRDDDEQDKAWMVEHHMVVARRLGWVTTE